MFNKKSSLPDTSNAVFIPTPEHLERKRKEKLKLLRSTRPKETDAQGDTALAGFRLNHRLLADIGEREVLHGLNDGTYGKPGDKRYDYTSAWVKDQEYERVMDYTDETLGIANEANETAKVAAAAACEANKLAGRAITVAIISAAIAMIALITTMYINQL